MSNGNTGKNFLKSRRFWGTAIAALGMILPEAGVGTPEDVAHLTTSFWSAFDAIASFGGLALAFWGGAVAKKPLAFKPSNMA